MNNIWKPDIIVLGPGGAKGYLELGLLLNFEHEKYLDEIKEWTGCSIGSSIALLIVAGYTVEEIINDSMNFNIINNVTDINIDNITNSPGLLTIKSAEEMLNLRLTEKFGYVPTLQQLWLSTGILLTVVTYNLDKMRPEYLSKDTEPNLSSVKAVLMSMSMPGIIVPRIYKGSTYVDGAIGDPYPILIHDNGTKQILGVYIDSEHSTYSSDKNGLRFLYRCAQASMKVLREQSIKLASDNCKHIILKTPVIDTTGLTLDDKSKYAMIQSGYHTGSVFLNKLRDPEKYKIILNDNEELIYIPQLSESDILNLESNVSENIISEDIYVPDI